MNNNFTISEAKTRLKDAKGTNELLYLKLRYSVTEKDKQYYRENIKVIDDYIEMLENKIKTSI